MTKSVLHIITRLIIGGAQENTMLTAAMLDKRHWNVDVISGPQTGSEGSLIQEVIDRGINLKIEPMLVREINPIKDFIGFFRLIRHMRKKRYHIVHTHSSKAGILARWAAWIAKVPIIIHTVHGWGHNDYQRPIVKKIYILLEKLSLLITDRLIAVSPLNIKKGLEDNIGKRSDYVVIRSGIEMERFGHPLVSRDDIRKQLGIPSNARVIGTVTRLSPQKAPLDFIRAAAILHKQYPEDLWFVMVGNGPLKQQVIDLAKQTGVDTKLVLTGLRRDIPELMAAFDIFVLTSLWEGLPRVIPQAMATGLPVVATAIDGNAEVVAHNKNGLLVTPSSPNQTAEAVSMLLNNPQIADNMASCGKQTVLLFSAETMVNEIHSLYMNLCV